MWKLYKIESWEVTAKIRYRDSRDQCKIKVCQIQVGNIMLATQVLALVLWLTYVVYVD